jgi:hypothetical protein
MDELSIQGNCVDSMLIVLIKKSSLNSRSLTFSILAATTLKQLLPLDPISGTGPNWQCKHLVEAFSSNMVAYLRILR